MEKSVIGVFVREEGAEKICNKLKEVELAKLKSDI